MRWTTWLSGAVAGMALTVGGVIVYAQNKPAAAPKEQERKVTEAEVPAAALATLKKAAGGAAFTEFAEEIEHGHKFYEGSWKSADGHVDCLVTETGDMVELEESVSADKVPASVRAAVEKEAGKDAKLAFERKTLTLYEVHFKKDGKGRELMFTADARRYHEGAHEGEGKGEKDDDDDDDDDDDGG